MSWREPTVTEKQESTMTRMPAIAGICYVRLPADGADGVRRFASELVGLPETAGVAGELRFRADRPVWSIAFTADRVPTLGLELNDAATLARTAALLGKHGFTVARADARICRARGVADLLSVQDGSGNRIELVVRPEFSARRFFPACDSGVSGVYSIGLRSTDLTRDLALWTGILGAEVRDRVGNITYLGCDEAHHRVALYPSDQTGLVYLALVVDELDDIMRGQHRLSTAQVRIVHGPGLEPASGNAFLRFAGPGGTAWSYVHPSAAPIRPRPRQFELSAASLCGWGSTCADLPELDIDRARGFGQVSNEQGRPQ
jgi:2,3-dihydroxy-p-cumate/2,3-dihydroxybenzoate 3,4-dioxygenase